MVKRFFSIGLLATAGVALSSLLTGPLLAQTYPGRTTAAAEIQVSAEKEALIREYLAVTESDALAAQMIEPMIPVFQEAYPSVPPEFFERIMAEITTGELSDFLIPVFAKNLTEQELQAAIAFYQSPEGASLLRKMPVLMQESQQAGAIWGAQLGERMIRELEEQNYLNSPSEI